MTDTPDRTVDQAARDLLAQVRSVVQGLLADKQQMQLEKREMGAALHAMTVLEGLTGRFGPLVLAHDKLGIALNMASPSAPPILSMTTEEPA